MCVCVYVYIYIYIYISIGIVHIYIYMVYLHSYEYLTPETLAEPRGTLLTGVSLKATWSTNSCTLQWV